MDTSNTIELNELLVCVNEVNSYIEWLERNNIVSSKSEEGHSKIQPFRLKRSLSKLLNLVLGSNPKKLNWAEDRSRKELENVINQNPVSSHELGASLNLYILNAAMYAVRLKGEQQNVLRKIEELRVIAEKLYSSPPFLIDR